MEYEQVLFPDGSVASALDVALSEARDPLGVEAGEGAAERLALAQDRDPRQASLKAVQNELFKQGPRIALRYAPFLVMIGDVNRVLSRPRAASEAVRVQNCGAQRCICHGICHGV
jgi:hypothetical protein